MSLSPRDISIPNDWDRRGLPGWTYHSPALLELEKEEVFRTHWQIACHASDVPEPGDYLTLDILGERAIVILGTDGFGRSDTRPQLRRHFEIDAECVTYATLAALAKSGNFDAAKLPQVLADLQIDPEKVDPLYA